MKYEVAFVTTLQDKEALRQQESAARKKKAEEDRKRAREEERRAKAEWHALFKALQVPASFICVAFLDDAKLRVAVTDRLCDADPARGIFHINSREGQQIVMAMAMKQERKLTDMLDRTAVPGRVIKICTNPDGRYEKYAEAYRQLAEVRRKATGVLHVWCYRAKQIRHPESLLLVELMLRGCRSSELKPMTAYYCADSQRFYVNEASYCQFCRKYGIPPLRFAQDDRVLQWPYTTLGFHDKSFLSQYGYTVRQDSPLTKEDRRSLLTMLMENGMERAADIRSHLEWLLNLNKTKPGFGKARCRWDQDLAFVNEYISQHSAIRTELEGRVVMTRS